MPSDDPKALPLPPPDLRQLVGPLEDSFYDNPSRALVFPDLPPGAFDRVLDFGCGCGRIARQLIQQRPRPIRYVGVDLHRGMIDWCRQNLAPRAPGFEFHHLDVHNPGLNPRGRRAVEPLPAPDRAVSLMIAWSVFTHVNEAAAEHYLREAARVLRPDGVLLSTWFLFDKADFPMMQEFQNALFINDVDPTNAVLFDKGWLRATAARLGLTLTKIVPPDVAGFQWHIRLAPRQPGGVEAEFPPDLAPRGVVRPPLMPERAERLGLREPSR